LNATPDDAWGGRVATKDIEGESRKRMKLIQFEDEDSDPYTIIHILEDGKISGGIMSAFEVDEFLYWLKERKYPESVKEAQNLLAEYDALIKKRAHESTQRIMNELKREREGTYEQRYARLAAQGYDDHTIHTKLFPEEYDFMFDDHVDYKLRQQGANPMSQEYIEETNARRVAGGFSLYGSGSVDKETSQRCSNQEKRPRKEKQFQPPSCYSERYARWVEQGYDVEAIHKRLFPEEYDYMCDTPEEARLRADGVNPKNKGYQNYVNTRRIAGDFPPFDSKPGNETMQWCQNKNNGDKA